MAQLLGRRCTYQSTQTGLAVQGYVVAVRNDEKVQVWTDKYQVPDNLKWRPAHLITLFADAALPPPVPASSGSGMLGLCDKEAAPE